MSEKIKFGLRYAVAVVVCIATWQNTAAAQYAAQGSHYPRLGNSPQSDTSATSPTGAYPLAIPLDLPAARGEVPVPFSVTNSASNQVGEAGVGWNVPIAYVRISRTVSRRTPFQLNSPASPAQGPTTRPQVFLNMGTGSTLMTQIGTSNLYLPVSADSYLQLHYNPDGTGRWRVRDKSGREYWFETLPALHDDDFAALVFINDSRSHETVSLTYEVDQHEDVRCDILSTQSAWSLPPELRLTELKYGYAPPAQGCATWSPKYRIALAYARDTLPWPQNSDVRSRGYCEIARPQQLPTGWLRLLGFADEDGQPRSRTQLLQSITVYSKPNPCNRNDRVLRTYTFGYTTDLDTDLPRLSSVGLIGTDGATATTPVARFTYGHMASASGLNFGPAYARKDLSFPWTNLGQTTTAGLPGEPRNSSESSTKTFLKDMTGDGVIDQVEWTGRELKIAASVWDPASSQFRFSTPRTYTLGSADWQISHQVFSRAAHESWFDEWMSSHDVVPVASSEFTDSELVDWNGDGRTDILTSQGPQWILFLNTPGSDPTDILWRQQSIDVSQVTQALNAAGYWRNAAWAPALSYAVSHTRIRRSDCVRYWFNDTDLNKEPWTDYWHHESCNDANYPVYQPESFGTKYVEWKLLDVNGDGMLDLVYSSTPYGFQAGFLAHSFDSCAVRNCRDTNAQIFNPNGTGHGASIPCDCQDTEDISPPQGALKVFYNTSRSTPSFAPQAVDLGMSGPVEAWISDDLTQSMQTGFVDINGDGIVDRVIGLSATLRSAGSPAQLGVVSLPGSPSTFKNSRSRVDCNAGGIDTRQVAGLIDLTGDGIPDYVSSPSPFSASVRVGKGFGYGSARPLNTRGGFELSQIFTWCGGQQSYELAGLMDTDGDGRVEVARVVNGALESELLTGATGSVQGRDAGHLTSVDNGYGGVTHLSYASAKEDATTAHQLPFPELVVAKVEVSADKFSDGFAPTRFAYGGARQDYNPILGRWIFPGYTRKVVVSARPGWADFGAPTSADLAGKATIIDSISRPSMAGQDPARLYAFVGRPLHSYLLTGTFADDPRALLGTNVATDQRWHGATDFDYAYLPLGVTMPPSSVPLGCDDVDPYSGVLSSANVCGIYGITYTQNTSQWSGDSAPSGSTSNVLVSEQITSVDTIGRALSVKHTSSGDATTCIRYTYATNANDPFYILDAVASIEVTNCGASPIVYSRSTTLYDNSTLPGVMTAGLVRERHSEIRDSQTRLKSGEVTLETLSYDLAGNVQQVVSARIDAGTSKTRTTTIGHDPFELVPERIDTVASDVATTQTTRISHDPVTMLTTDITTPDGLTAHQAYDGFGRSTTETLTEPGGETYFVGRTDYEGDDPTGDVSGLPLNRGVGRHVKHTRPFKWKHSADDLAPSEKQVSTTYLDEFARPRFTEVFLGSDYGNKSIIHDLTRRDGFGRPALIVDPVEASAPPNQWYGTAFQYSETTNTLCKTRGTQWPSARDSDVSQDIFASCSKSYFFQNRMVTTVTGPSERQPGSVQFGAFDQNLSSASGRVLSTGRYQNGKQLDLSTYDYDAAGNLIGTVRYGVPETAAQPLTWTFTWDSMGRRTSSSAPGIATHQLSYDEWGLLTSDIWQDSGIKRTSRWTYDGLGRKTHFESNREIGGIAITDSYSDYGYDVPDTDPDHPAPGYLTGRLAWAYDGSVRTMFGYDRTGRVIETNRVVLDSAGVRQLLSEGSQFAPDGSLSVLTFSLPDNDHHPEAYTYLYDSAARLEEIDADATAPMPLFLAESIDPLGRYRSIRYANDVTEQLTYRTRGRQELSEHLLTANGDTRRLTFDGYDSAGRLLRRIDGSSHGPNPETNNSTSYTYDALGRLATSTISVPFLGGTINSITNTYAYDGVGNLISHRIRTTQADTTTGYFSSTIDPDRLCSAVTAPTGTLLTPPRSCQYTYDASGSVARIAKGSTTQILTYDSLSRTTSVVDGDKKITYSYGAFGDTTAIDETSVAERLG